MRKLLSLLLISLCLLSGLGLSACGQKGPLIPPSATQFN
ncbi:lipoprotein [Gammaproteobacteria bacterium]|nr:lipoprotein [Gammaproteobacteria bacterium]